MDINEKKPEICHSKVLNRIRAGEVACSIKINVSGLEAAEIAAISGFDCVWTCMEHCPHSIETIKVQAAVCRIHDTDLLVRVPRGSYSDYILPLEANAAGIMIPHIMSYEDAKRAVWQTRFHPVGRRPLDGGNSDGKYGLLPLDEYFRQSNERKMVVLQIEDPEPLERDLEAICELSGYDILYFGPGDFAHALGISSDFSHKDIITARRRIAKTARRFGKAAGTVGVWDIRELIDEGYQFINLGSDVEALVNYYSAKRQNFNEIIKGIN